MNNFQKSQSQKILSLYNNAEDILEKAHPVGYINKHGYQKQQDGSWKWAGKKKVGESKDSKKFYDINEEFDKEAYEKKFSGLKVEKPLSEEKKNEEKPYSDIESGVTTMKEVVEDVVKEFENYVGNFSSEKTYIKVEKVIKKILANNAIDVSDDELKEIKEKVSKEVKVKYPRSNVKYI